MSTTLVTYKREDIAVRRAARVLAHYAGRPDMQPVAAARAVRILATTTVEAPTECSSCGRGRCACWAGAA